MEKHFWKALIRETVVDNAEQLSAEDPYRSPQVQDVAGDEVTAPATDSFVFRATLFVAVAFATIYLIAFLGECVWNVSKSNVAPSVRNLLTILITAGAIVSTGVVLASLLLNRRRMKLIAAFFCLLAFAALTATMYLS